MKMFPMVPGSAISEAAVGDEVVLIVGIQPQQHQQTELDDGWTYQKGVVPALHFVFLTRYKGTQIVSAMKTFSSTEALDAFRQEFEENLPELKKRIDDEKSKVPTGTASVGETPNG